MEEREREMKIERREKQLSVLPEEGPNGKPLPRSAPQLEARHATFLKRGLLNMY